MRKFFTKKKTGKKEEILTSQIQQNPEEQLDFSEKFNGQVVDVEDAFLEFPDNPDNPNNGGFGMSLAPVK